MGNQLNLGGVSIKWTDYIPHKPTPKQLAFLMLPHREALFGGAAGGGKVVYDDAEVLTPFGFRKGKDLRLGDRVNNPDGSVSRIVFLHPRQEYQVWRVCFHDGSTTDVAAEHLWLAWRSGKRGKRSGVEKFGEVSAEVIPTCELKAWLEVAQKQERNGQRPNWPCIPVAQPQRFNVTRRKFSEIDPYLLGTWLGDGHAGKSKSGSLYAGITSADLDHTRLFMAEHQFSESSNENTDVRAFLFRGNSLKWFCGELQKLKLFGKHSWDKFLPDEFKYGSLEKRTAILQGLMDTDGYVDGRGQLYYTTVSKELASGMKFLVQSLGGTATQAEKIGGYISSSGVRVSCRVAYTLYVKLPRSVQPFRLARKVSRLRGEDLLYRRVVSVIPVKERKFGRCITVSHPNGLYLTNDFIVTHNSDALLMAALQYVDVPGYSAMILRRTLADLKMPGALLDRAHQWLGGTPAKYVASDHKYLFPTVDHEGNPSVPASLSFGYIGEADARTRYQGIELQFCAFDETTQHMEDDYRYLFSRLRKNACPIHKTDADGFPHYDPGCHLCRRQKQIPVRARGATNPGGRGAAWIKNRFRIEPRISIKECEKQGIKPEYVGKHPHRPFIPSFAKDNPFLNLEAYSFMLDELDPITRDQLKEGRWDVSANAKFKRHWARYYTSYGDYFLLGSGPSAVQCRYDQLQRIFVTVDPAASARHGPGDNQIWKKDPSYTVIAVWGLTNDYRLVWLDMIRFRREIPDIILALKRVQHQWHPQYFVIEANGLGQGVYQTAMREGLTVKTINTRVDKVTNAAEAMLRMERGLVYFPENASWLSAAEDEIFYWTGDPLMTDDIIDVLSAACRDITWEDQQIYPDNPDDLRARTFGGESPSVVYSTMFDQEQDVYGVYY